MRILLVLIILISNESSDVKMTPRELKHVTHMHNYTSGRMLLTTKYFILNTLTTKLI